MPPMQLEDDDRPQLNGLGECCSVEVRPERAGFSLDDSHLLLVDNTNSTAIFSQRRSSDGSNVEKINWSNSDEDSHSTQGHRHLLRSYSDPSLEEGMLLRDPIRSFMFQEPRRRSRSSCSRSAEEELSLGGGGNRDSMGDCHSEEKTKRKPALYTHGFASSSSRTVARYSPIGLLSILFVVCCYTTFCLPYPGVRPQDNHIPKLRRGIPMGIQNNSVPAIGKASPGVFHARASPEVELTFRPGLERYYAQEAFSAQPWTKYADVAALGIVLVWAVIQCHRRGEPLRER